jgi:hypothetical protein
MRTTSPGNTTLIQVGFNKGLEYPFVVSTDNSASQIFAYLPKGIACALGIDEDRVIMNALLPYDTTKQLGFITTLAQAFIPSNRVDELQMDLHNPNSEAYNSPDPAVRSLMLMINPTIPILPGASMDDSDSQASSNSPVNNGDSPSSPGGGNGNGAPIGGDSGTSQKVSKTTALIGVGAVAGAAAYAAAMVYVARRYRKKRQSHRRSSSLTSHGEMSERSPGTPATLTGGMGGYFMSGANGLRGSGTSSGGRGPSGRGNSARASRNSAGSSTNNRSVREQGISAPVMAENSLGWN